jgi:hypothetical protein
MSTTVPAGVDNMGADEEGVDDGTVLEVGVTVLDDNPDANASDAAACCMVSSFTFNFLAGTPDSSSGFSRLTLDHFF